MKKLAAAFVAVVLVFGGIMPFVRHAHLASSLEADLRNIAFEYNTLPRAKFLERVDAMCMRSQVDTEFSVELSDSDSGAFTLTVSYVDEFKILFLIPKTTPVEIVIRGTRIEV